MKNEQSRSTSSQGSADKGVDGEAAVLNVEQFNDFFEQIHGVKPYSWQIRLAREVLEKGKFPETIKMPTGSGKTAIVDIAIFALASKPELFPRRIVFVIDRRIVVDQVYERVQRISDSIRKPKSQVMELVSASLSRLSDASEPIGSVSLRGGTHIDGEWTKRIDQPSVIVSTVDHFGSRLLFRGYGVSKGMRPIHAGLTGNDCLVILDEVHLSIPFKDTLRKVQSMQSEHSELVPSRFQVVEMSATPRETHGSAFELTQVDIDASGSLRRRLCAPKSIELHEIKNRDSMAGFVAKNVENLRKRFPDELLSSRSSCFTIGVILNRVQSARETWSMLRDKDFDASLIVGRMRPLDKAESVEKLVPYVSTDQKFEETGFHIVVGTQAIEVGADFDFDYLITEFAPIDCLRQRFGRLDRQGMQYNKNGSASVCAVVGIKSELSRNFQDPIYGSTSKHTWEFLSRMSQESNEFQFSSDPNLELNPPSECYSPHLDAPLLLQTYADAWVQTNPEPGVQPDVEWFLHGIDIDNQKIPEVSVVWRWDCSSEALSKVPVRPAERLELPIHAAKKWLSTTLSDLNDASAIVDDIQHRTRNTTVGGENKDITKVSVLRGQSVESVNLASIRPGDTVLVSPERGGLANGVWDPTSHDTVRDLGDLAQFVYGRRVTLRLDRRTILDTALEIPVPADEIETEEPRDLLIKRWLQLRRAEVETGSQEYEIIHRLLGSGGYSIVTRTLEDGQGDVNSQDYYILLERDQAKKRPKVDESEMVDGEESGSITGTGVTLKSHLEGVGRRAADTAKRLGFDDKLVSDIELSGQLHDIGKIDERFQKMLVGGDEIRFAGIQEPLAKSLPDWKQTNVYPAGMRHESASVALITSNLKILSEANDEDLVLHLVGAHHGWCRPFPRIVSDEHPLPLRYAINGVVMFASSDLTDGELALECSDRFWRLVRRYGHYGLAWFESVLRLADHVESSIE